MQIGLGIGIPFTKSQVWLAVQAVFTPAKLFDSGANGLWLDPSDLTTMFQDSAGTTPVTAVEQPVGLILDKSKELVPGSERIVNGAFDLPFSTGWVNNAAIASIVSDAGNNVLSLSAAGGASNVNQSITGLASKVVQLSFKRRGIATGVGLTGKIQFVDSNLVALGTPMPSVSVVVRADYEQITVKCFVPANAAGIRLLATTTSDDSIGKVYFDDISIKEIPGNHAFQSINANRPTLSARYNLLTKTEQFDDVAWTKQSGTVVSNTKVAAPDGSLTAFSIVGNGTSGIFQAVAGSVSLGETTRAVYLRVTAGTATVGIKDPAWTQGTTTCNLTTVWQRFSLTETATPSAGFAGGIWVFNIPATGIEMAWPDFRSSKQSSLPYQRVNTATDYDSDQTKFPRYLAFNYGTYGNVCSLQTASINFTATDKMFVSAGVRKLSDASRAMLFEFGLVGTSNGSFNLNAPEPPYEYDFGSQGTTSTVALLDNATFAAPITSVLSGIGNISGDQAILRVNGTQTAISAADQGTGNYGNYPLYIGARAGTSLFFSGNLYQLVIAGKQASTEEIDSTENYIELKTFGKDMSYVYDYLVDSTGNQITDSAGNPIYVTATYQ